MSGPRVTSGTESKQDYATPGDFMSSVEQQFGKISFDLAAHSGNTKHSRYFAPTEFVEKGTADDLKLKYPIRDTAMNFMLPAGVTYLKNDKKGKEIFERRTPNVDPMAYGMDAFVHDWSELTRKFQKNGETGILWLNCEFDDIARWSKRCHEEQKKGARILLLTPLTTANWYRDSIAGKADVYHLVGRLCFDGKNVFPKDCMLSHFFNEPLSAPRRGNVHLWDWKKNAIVESWINDS